MDSLLDIIIRSIMTLIVYSLAKFYTYKIGTTRECTSKPLYDVMHEILPDISKYIYYRDIILLLFFIPIIFISFKLDFLYDLWHYFTIIITFKAILIFFTFLPPSNPDCHKKKYMNHCYHNQLSGHASLCQLLIILYIKYGLFNEYMYLLVILYCILILLTRAHYTSDIIQALIITNMLVL